MPTAKSRYYLSLAVLAFVAVALARSGPSPAGAAAGDKDVRVINTVAEAVPTVAQGTTAVSGVVQAQQSGAWTVGVAGVPTVQLDTGPANPVYVRNVDEPARHAFQTTVQIEIPSADGAAMGFVTVPAGQRLVVEFVSVNGNVASGRTLLVQLSTFGSVGEVFHEIALTGPRPLGNDIYTASQPVRIYAVEQLTLRAVHSASAAALASHVSVGISGYLVDSP